MSQPSLFEGEPPPRRVRRADPDTSKDAAAKLSTAESHCRAMLSAYAKADRTQPGLTDEQAAYNAGIHVPGICWWHRASDLRKLGLIEWMRQSGDGKRVKRMGSNGREVGVSVITDKGRAEARR